MLKFVALQALVNVFADCGGFHDQQRHSWQDMTWRLGAVSRIQL